MWITRGGRASGKGSNALLRSRLASSISRPPHTNIKVTLDSQDEDGWHRDYSVIEETPPAAKPAPAPITSTVPDFRTMLSAPIYPEESQWEDWLEETLQIAEAEIEIHIIEALDFKTHKHSVRRHRREKTVHLDF